MFIDFRERGRGREGDRVWGERERETSMWEASIGCLPYMPWPGIKRKPSMGPDWRSNPQPFGLWDDRYSNQLSHTGQGANFPKLQIYVNGRARVRCLAGWLQALVFLLNILCSRSNNCLLKVSIDEWMNEWMNEWVNLYLVPGWKVEVMKKREE